MSHPSPRLTPPEGDRGAGGSDDRFRRLAEAAPIGIVEADPDGTLVYVNDAWRRLSGHTGPTPIPATVLDGLIHPEDRDRMARQVGDAVRVGGDIDVTVRFQRQDGTVRWARVQAAPYAEGERRGGYVGTATDMTEIEEARRVRDESEQRYRRLILDAPVPQLVSELDGTLIEFNTAFLELMRSSPEAVTARAPIDIVHPDDVALLAEEVDKLARGETEYFDVERRLVRPDGSVLVVTGGTTLLHDGDELHLHTVIIDITERTIREQELRESENRFRTLAESLPVGVFRSDPQGNFTYVNPRWLAINDVTRDELDRPDAGDLVHPDDRTQLWDQVAQGLRRNGRYSVQYRIVTKDGAVRWIAGRGALTLDPDTREVTGLVGSIEDVTERRRLETELAHRATHDALTGLPNRALLLDHLELGLARAERDGSIVALLFLDLDRFKGVNDLLGHEAGDELLREAARRLADVLRPTDTVARLGGDEFVVLCEDIEDENHAITVAQRISAAIDRKPFHLAAERVAVSASIGIALSGARPAHPESLLRDADAAMYRAKELGRARIEIFDESLHAEAASRNELADQLARGLEDGAIVVHYQPCVDLVSRRVRSVEALARWEHPERGTLLPKEFIQVAEDTGLIVGLGLTVLSLACRQARAWEDLLGADAPAVHVNLSARQLTASNLPSLVEGVLRGSELAPSKLCLEITESVLMDDAPSVIDTLWALKAIGVSIAIDDFGTGYSSLSYLRRFPVDVLKVDQSFVDGLGPDPEDSTIVAAIVNLARTLDLEPVAEGVETEEQVHLLRDLGCASAQGFYFAAPLPPAELIPLLATTLPAG